MKKPVKIILIILSVLCFISVLIGINSSHISPFQSTVRLEDMTLYAYSNNGSAAVTGQRQKLLIMDSSEKLTKIIDMKTSGSPFDRINKICIYGDTIYVAGASYFNHGTYLSKEAMVAYSLDGSFKETIYEKTYDDNSYVTSCNIKTFLVNNTGIYITESGGSSVSVRLISGDSEKTIISSELGEEVSDAYYYARKNQLVVITRSLEVYRLTENENATLLDLKDPAFWLSLSDDDNEHFTSLYNYWEYYGFPIVTFENEYISFFSFTHRDCTSGARLSLKTKEFTEFSSIPVSAFLRIKNFLFYFSLIFLLLLVSVIVIYSVIKKKINTRGVRVLLLVLIVLITCVFYSVYSYKQTRSSYENLIQGEANLIEAEISNYLLSHEEEIRGDGVRTFVTSNQHISEFSVLQNILVTTCNSFGSNNSTFAKVLLCDSDGEIYSLLESQGANYYGRKLHANISEYEEQIEYRGSSVKEVITNDSSSYAVYRAISDSSGKILGIVIVGYYADNLAKVQTDLCIEMFVNLSVIMIVIYICCSLGVTFYHDFQRRKTRPKEEAANRSADIAGVFIFLQGIVNNIDLVILVFVSQYLCRDMDPVAAAAMAAIPLSASSIGQWIGTFFASPIIKKLGERKSSYVGSLVGIGALLLIVFSIISDSFLLFVAGKFLTGTIVRGFLFVLGDTIPFGATNEDIKAKAVNSTKEANYSASILSILLAGYISQFLSYSAIYLLGAVVMGVLLILTPVFFQKTKKNIQSISAPQPAKKEKGMGWALWLTPTMLIFAFLFMLPRGVMLGYSSYFFPVYTNNAGISTLLISNLSVYAKTAAYLFSSNIFAFTKRHSRASVLAGSQLIISVSFIFFLISPSVYWAIVVLFISAIFDRMTQSVATLYVSDVAAEKNYEGKQAVSNYYTVNSATFVVQSPIISAFLGLGYNFACAALGSICTLMIALFSIFNKKHNKKKQE